MQEDKKVKKKKYGNVEEMGYYSSINLYVRVLISLWLSKGILFLQDSAAPHNVAITHQKLADLHFEFLEHLAYSSDLAPSDYYLFPILFIKPKTYQPTSYKT
jgi:hypothetical protein